MLLSIQLKRLQCNILYFFLLLQLSTTTRLISTRLIKYSNNRVTWLQYNIRLSAKRVLLPSQVRHEFRFDNIYYCFCLLCLRFLIRWDFLGKSIKWQTFKWQSIILLCHELLMRRVFGQKLQSFEDISVVFQFKSCFWHFFSTLIWFSI